MTVRLIAIMLCLVLAGCAATDSGSTPHVADRQPGESNLTAAPDRNDTTGERLGREFTSGAQQVVNGASFAVYQTFTTVGLITSVLFFRGNGEIHPGAEWVPPFP